MKIITLSLVIGLSMLLSSCSTSKIVVLDQDIDLEENYLFKDKPPLIGTINSGTKVHVNMVKGNVAYISIQTAINHDELMKASHIEGK